MEGESGKAPRNGLVQQFIRQLLSNSPVAALAQREDQGEICDHSSA